MPEHGKQPRPGFFVEINRSEFEMAALIRYINAVMIFGKEVRNDA